MSSTPMQIFKKHCGAGSSERETPNMARQRLWFTTNAWRTLRGIEAMEMVRKGRAKWVAKGNVVGQVTFISSLFRVAA
jgi:hypothetical protein